MRGIDYMKLMTNLSNYVLAALLTLSIANAAEWSYEEQKRWGSIEDHSQHEVPHIYPYAVCSIGQHQSPVDLATSQVSKRLNNLKFRYYADKPDFFNTGHAVQVNLSNDYQGELLVGKEAYPLIQLHFHEPSEHVIGTKIFPAELHFVHVRGDGKIAVLGVLLEIGKDNPVFQTILENTPPQGGELKQDSDVWLSITSLLPEKRDEYYTLAGSLTTPPCSEGVDWYVLTDTTEISEAQLDRLKSFFSGNARLKQELNNRAIAKKK